MNNKLISIIVIIVLLVGGFFLFKGRTTAPTQPVDTQETADPTTTDDPAAASGGTQPVTKEFTVEGANFAFAPKELKAKVGDTIKLTFKNVAGVHDLRIDELNVSTKVLQAGQSEIIEFTVDRSGTFEYYCGVGNHRTMGMVGNLVVEQ